MEKKQLIAKVPERWVEARETSYNKMRIAQIRKHRGDATAEDLAILLDRNSKRGPVATMKEEKKQ